MYTKYSTLYLSCQNSFKNPPNRGLLLAPRKARLGFTRKPGVASAFIFDPCRGLPRFRWTGDQPTPVIQYVLRNNLPLQRLYRAFSGRRVIAVYLHPLVNNTIRYDPGNFPTPPYCVSGMRYFLFLEVVPPYPMEVNTNIDGRRWQNVTNF